MDENRKKEQEEMVNRIQADFKKIFIEAVQKTTPEDCRKPIPELEALIRRRIAFSFECSAKTTGQPKI